MLSPTRLGWGLVLVFLVSAPSWAEPGEPVVPLVPDDAVASALSSNPDVLAAEAALLLAEGELAQALGANPSLSGSLLMDGPAELQLSQPVSPTGAGVHARHAASARVDEAEAMLHRTRFEVAHGVRTAYTEAVVATRVSQVADEGLALATRLHAAVVRLHEEGEASTLDLNLARLAQAQAAARLLDALEGEADALVALAAIVTRPVESRSLLLDLALIAPTPSHAGERSDVLAAQSALLAAEREIAAQRAAAVSPLLVGVVAESQDGATLVGPSLTVELPVRDRNQAGRAGALGDLQVAESRLVETQAVATMEVTTATRRDELATSALLAVGEYPMAAARAALASVEAGYLAGEIDLTSTVLLQAQILDGETAVVQLEGHVATARLDLLLATEDPVLLGGAR
ncbi:MAG: TolC family protein [Myxococcota bacterium]|nr:TolC family protein [Myxococcota bacterium]